MSTTTHSHRANTHNVAQNSLHVPNMTCIAKVSPQGRTADISIEGAEGGWEVKDTSDQDKVSVVDAEVVQSSLGIELLTEGAALAADERWRISYDPNKVYWRTDRREGAPFMVSNRRSRKADEQ